MGIKNFSFTRFDIYDYLDDKYDLAFSHSISKMYFYHNAALFEQYIPIYFNNPTLFVHLKSDASISLSHFLGNDPEALLTALMEPPPLTFNFYPLMDRQLAVKADIEQKENIEACNKFMTDYADLLQNRVDDELSGTTLTAVHDNRYIQPMKFRFPPRFRSYRRY